MNKSGNIDMKATIKIRIKDDCRSPK